MKTTKFSGLLLAAVFGLMVSCSKENVSPTETSASSSDGKTTGTTIVTEGNVTGNGSLSGSHYQLNIIGVPRNKTADMTGNNGGRIFVPMYGTTKIMLSEGAFGVLDANGTDGVAKFQLPNPDADNDGITSYSVFARPLGTPGGTSTTTTCATDPLTGLVVCSNASYVAVRTSGKTSFTNVSNQLLYVYSDLDGDGVAERYPLFDDRLEDYFWQYENTGLKLLQLRFYPISTNVN